MTDAQKLAGHCHCGAVQFEVEADLGMTVECNCSHCSAKGLVLAFAPLDNFRLVAGEGELSEYRFNKHQIAHRFCATCGAQPFSMGERPDGAKTVAINLRCVDGIEIEKLSPKKVDGRSF